MSDNDISKALGFCFAVGDCDHCAYADKPCQNLMADALDLINRQKAEIERLKDMVAQNEGVLPRYEQLIKAEAIEEFAERLRNKFFNYYDGLTENTSKSNHNGDSLMFYEVADMITDCIESTEEEMTEEDNA